jgi:hypothetical protein
MDKRTRYAPELRERAVRMVREQERGVPLTVGGDRLDYSEDRVPGRDPAAVGAAGGTG